MTETRRDQPFADASRAQGTAWILNRIIHETSNEGAQM